MKAILVIIILLSGSGKAIQIEQIEFNNLESCYSAQNYIEEVSKRISEVYCFLKGRE